MKGVKKLLSLLILPSVLSGATLLLKKREIRPRGKVALEAPGPRWTAGRSHVILQFNHPVNQQMVRELNDRGAYIVGAVPEFGVMVSVTDEFSLEGLGAVWAARLNIDDKVSPLLEKLRSSGDTWVVVEFYPDVDMGNARRLADAAGFQVHEHRDLMQTHLLLSGPPERLTGLAQWDEVAYVFPASRPLIRGQRVSHCAGALTSGGAVPMYVTAGSGWPKDADGAVTLSYVFGAITPKLDPAQATQEILRALNSWGQYAPIKFVAGESGSAKRTVYIQFVTYDHGDGYPFDGPGGILAHTFYPAPPNPESIAGDMHLDGSENWHIGANTDLYTVAVHEAGHALGLAHTDDPNAVMYPYYRLGSKIAADDIAGIQSLYGAAPATTAPVTTNPVLTLAISAPAANSTTANATQTVTGTTSGVTGNVQITWQTDHGASGAATGTSQWTAAAVPLVVGSNTITLTAMDAAAKSVQALSVARSAPPPAPSPAPSPGPLPPVSRTPPSLSITSPSGGIVTTSATTIDVKGTASDNVGVSKVTWTSSAGTGTATGTTNWIASAVPLLVGDNSIIVRAYDSAGNMSWRRVLVIRY